jgi:hypothetical protein
VERDDADRGFVVPLKRHAGILDDVEDVADQLGSSAPRFARDSLVALSNDDAVGFALYAATSLEHLLKSFLAGKHPALIVDAWNLDSLLHACGQDAAATTKRDEVKTISAAECLDRVARFLPLLSSHSKSLKELFGVRNGAIHLGDRGTVEPFVLPFLRVSEQVRDALELDRADYWGEYITLADSTIREHVAAAELKAAAAIGAARARFAERYGDLDERSLTTAIAAIEANTFRGYEQQPVTCPACSYTALAVGTVETEWRYDEDGYEGFIPSLDATFFPEGLKCPVCGLALNDDDELRAAGVGRYWEIDVDEDDFIHEPDEDWYRGR